MSSRFSERLDFLMSVTNTTNSALARELSFDASYISRIRNGKRGMPLHQPFVEPASKYLSGRIREQFQIRAIETALNLPGSWPRSPKRAAKLLASWLVDESSELDERFDRLLSGLSTQGKAPESAMSKIAPANHAMHVSGSAQEGPVAGTVNNLHEPPNTGLCVNTCFYFGPSGRRDAIERLLTSLVATGRPHELLVYSDESFEWFTSDLAFVQRWRELLIQLLRNGTTITIVHTVTRDISEMLDAVQGWLPVYLTGRVTSYYCPRIRDGICRRTMVLAPGNMAVVGNSVESNLEGALCQLTDTTAVVEACEREFRSLLALCRPLVSVSQLSDHQRVSDMLSVFEPATEHVVMAFSDESAPKSPAFDGIRGRFEGRVELKHVPKLPKDVIAIVGYESGFAIAHYSSESDSGVLLLATERLLATAFTEYLGA